MEDKKTVSIKPSFFTTEKTEEKKNGVLFIEKTIREIPLSQVVKNNISLEHSVDKLFIAINGFRLNNKGEIITPNNSVLDIYGFTDSLEVVANKDFTNDDKDKQFATFKEGETIPFRIITERLIDNGYILQENRFSFPICDDNLFIYIELDLTKPKDNYNPYSEYKFIGINPNSITSENDFKVIWKE